MQKSWEAAGAVSHKPLLPEPIKFLTCTCGAFVRRRHSPPKHACARRRFGRCIFSCEYATGRAPKSYPRDARAPSHTNMCRPPLAQTCVWISREPNRAPAWQIAVLTVLCAKSVSEMVIVNAAQNLVNNTQ